MPLPCRQRLVQIARKHNALIISDDIYDMLQWPSSRTSTSLSRNRLLPRFVDIDRSLPPLASDPHHFGYALSNGSFSKIIAPGVRTGWVDASPALAVALGACGSTLAGGCPSGLMAAIIAQLMRGGFLQAHVSKTLIPAYRRRREIMVEAIERHLGPLGVALANISSAEEYFVGGYFLWMKLPDGVISSEVGKMAKEEESLAVSPGVTFGVSGDDKKWDFERFLRLSFSYDDETNLVEGTVRLARIIRRLLKQNNKESSTLASMD